MELTKEEAKVILDLYKQLDGLDTPEKIYSINNAEIKDETIN